MRTAKHGSREIKTKKYGTVRVEVRSVSSCTKDKTKTKQTFMRVEFNRGKSRIHQDVYYGKTLTALSSCLSDTINLDNNQAEMIAARLNSRFQ